VCATGLSSEPYLVTRVMESGPHNARHRPSPDLCEAGSDHAPERHGGGPTTSSQGASAWGALPVSARPR